MLAHVLLVARQFRGQVLPRDGDVEEWDRETTKENRTD